MRKHFSILALFVLLACILPMAASAATLKLPAALKTIETETFYGDTSLDAVQLPEGITSIESRAFANSSVNEINLPASLIYIADNAFSGSSLAAVHAERGTYAYEWAVQHGYLKPVTGIAISHSTNNHYIGSVGNYTDYITISPANATNKTLYWSSSNPAAITIDRETGDMNCVAAGTSDITATTADGGFTATCRVTVVPPPTGISLDKTEITVPLGGSQPLTAAVLPEGTIYKSITWKSSNENVAAVNSAGVVSGKAIGTATITATVTTSRNIEYSASCLINVVSLNARYKNGNGGPIGKAILVTSTSNWTAKTDAAWFSLSLDQKNQSKTISGSAGTDLTCYASLQYLPVEIAHREANIEFTNSDSTIYLKVTQDRSDAPMTGVSFNSASGTIAVGQTQTLVPAFEPVYASDRRVTWSSDSTAVATVDANGNVKGIAPGTAKITVKTTDGGFTAVYTVNVNLKVTGGTKANGIVCRGFYVTATSAWTATTEDSWIKINSVLDSNTASNKISGTATTDLKCYAWLTELPLTVASRTGHIVFKCGDTSYTLNIVQDRTDAPMVGVSLSPNSAIIPQYGTVSPTVSFNPYYATDKRITWSSSNTSVATVDENGKITGKAAGTADITVTTTDGSKTATCKVTVVKLNISPTYGIMAVGTSKNLQSSVLPTSLSDFTTTWTSSDDTVLHVDTTTDTNQKPYIKVTGKKAGMAVITGKTKLGGAICTYTMTVVSTTLNKTSLSLVVDGSETLKATVNPSQYNGAANGVTWSSSNEKVAAVDQNGKVTAKTAGTATITATSTYGGAKATCDVTVVNKVSVASISVPKNSYTVSEVVPYTIKISGGKEPYTVKVVEYFNGSYKWDKTVTPDEEMKYIYNADFYNSDFKKGGTNYIVVTVTDSLGNTATKQSGNVTITSPVETIPSALTSVLSSGCYISARTYWNCDCKVYRDANFTTRGNDKGAYDACTESPDEIHILAVGNNSSGNAYARVEYPASGTYVGAYMPLTDLVTGTGVAGLRYALHEAYNLYDRPGGSIFGEIYSDDRVYTLSEKDGYKQVMYNVGSNWKIGWLTNQEYENMFITITNPIETIPSALTSVLSSGCYISARTYWNCDCKVYRDADFTTRGNDKGAYDACTESPDEIHILAVGNNSSGSAYARVEYPASGTYVGAYMPLTDLVTGTGVAGLRYALHEAYNLYDRPGGSVFGEIWSDDRVYTLSEKDGYKQVMYDVGSNWKIGWLTNQEYEAMFSSTPAPTPGGSYDPSKAVAYARDHWNDAADYAKADCANFVSKCLAYGGGLQTDGTWYKGSSAWINTGSMLSYFKGKPGWTVYESNYSLSMLSPGDIVWCEGVDNNGKPVYRGHVVLVTSVSSNSFTYCGHTANQLDRTAYVGYIQGIAHYGGSNVSSITDKIRLCTNINSSKREACAIVTERLQNEGFELAFIAGVCANINAEGNFGVFESSYYIGDNAKNKPNYLVYMDNNYNYALLYSGQNVVGKNLQQLKNILLELQSKDWPGGFGLGSIQWTWGRTLTLVDCYISAANGSDTVTSAQCITGEMNMLVSELTGSYSSVYNNWKSENSANINSETSAYNAGYTVCYNYEKPSNRASQAVTRGNKAKEIYNYITSN